MTMRVKYGFSPAQALPNFVQRGIKVETSLDN